MKKIIVLCLGAFSFLGNSTAQSPQIAAYSSLGVNDQYTTISFGGDMRWQRKKGCDVAANIETGFTDNYSKNYMGIGYSWLFGKTHSFELGTKVFAPICCMLDVDDSFNSWQFDNVRFAPILGHRLQNPNRWFFLKFAISPVSFATDGGLDYFYYYNAQLSLGYNFRTKPKTITAAPSAYIDSTVSQKMILQHSVSLSASPLGLLGYELRLHRATSPDFAFGLNAWYDIPTQISSNNYTHTGYRVSPSATVIFGKSNTHFELGLAASYQFNYYFETHQYDGHTYGDKNLTESWIAGLPMGMRYQPANSGIYVRVFTMFYAFMRIYDYNQSTYNDHTSTYVYRNINGLTGLGTGATIGYTFGANKK
jgi:hypothetical protein